jgi:hypothetical protein
VAALEEVQVTRLLGARHAAGARRIAAECASAQPLPVGRWAQSPPMPGVAAGSAAGPRRDHPSVVWCVPGPKPAHRS